MSDWRGVVFIVFVCVCSKDLFSCEVDRGKAPGSRIYTYGSKIGYFFNWVVQPLPGA